MAPAMPMSYSAAIARPPRRLRIGLCDTTFTGDNIHDDCAAAVRETGKLLESLGHHVTPALPRADHDGMMRAWTKIVACGTALSVRGAKRPDDLQGVSRSAAAYAAGISGADYLAAVGKIHSYGREMAAIFGDYDILLCATLAEPPALVGRFTHDRDDYENYRIGPGGVFAYSPFCAAFNASGQPAATVPLHHSADGLPIGVHLAAAFGDDTTLIALCAELEQAAPWAGRRPDLSTKTLA
jgi:amidase/6-aminohexanoate-cyclic-dimer hydrolase